MQRAYYSIGLLAFTTAAALAQSTDGPPKFEVAAVKRASPDSGEPGSNNMRGGPGTADPGRISFPSVTLTRLLMAAYGVDADQISGPGWLDSERYSVVANVLPGASREQLELMLQSLIAERFQAVVHHGTKVITGYVLVAAPRGPKLQASQEGIATLPRPQGFPQALPGRYAATRTDSGLTRLSFNRYSMSDLARMLGLPLGTVVGNRVASAVIADQTGLTGKYDFTLEFAGFLGPGGAFPPPASDVADISGPSLFVALETQLGLRLQEKKVPHDVLVIDSINRIPVEN